jgi:hypothetical protein
MRNISWWRNIAMQAKKENCNGTALWQERVAGSGGYLTL